MVRNGIFFLVAMSVLSSSADTVAQRRLTLNNTVYGSPEANALYPYSPNAWPIATTGSLLSFNDEGEYVLYKENGSQEVVSNYYAVKDLIGTELGVGLLAVVSDSRMWVEADDAIHLCDVREGKVLSTLAGPYDKVDLSVAGGRAAMVVGRDLYVATPEGRVRVNEVSEEGVRYGSTVHRSEFGIEKGTFWSPDGETLCFYRDDEALVDVYPLVSVKQDFAKVVPTRYPMAGRTSESVSVGLYNVRSRKTVYLQTQFPVDRYFTNISWSPDSKMVCVAEINRDQDHMKFNLYDASTGALVKTLFEEKNSKWIEPCVPAVWVDKTHFGWLSYRDGFNHLYLYDVTDGSCRQLTSGDWCVTALYGYNTKKKCFVVQTNSEGYMYRDVCSVDLRGRLTRLSPGQSVSSATMSPCSSLLFVESSSPAVAVESAVVDYGGKRKVVFRNADPYAEFVKPEIKTVPLKSADGQFDFTGRLVLPTDFDPGKKYPVIVYVYGGPHSQLVNAGWLYGANPWMLYLAQEGYIVFTMDNRGTECRGSAAEQCIHRRLGVCEAEDQMVGVNYLRSLPYVDDERIGVHGWSFGGFMTINLMTAYPGVFKAGVAGGPVCDWRFYEVMYGERYMDTPEQNPEGYDATSMCERIGDLSGRLLVIHGAMDSTVVWQNSLALINSSLKHDLLVDYAVYPNHPHNVRGHDRVNLIARIKRYFDDFLK